MLFQTIASSMRDKAAEKQEAAITDMGDMSAESIPEGRIVRIGWCGNPECGHRFEDRYDIKILGTPYRGDTRRGKCIVCGADAGTAIAARTM